jgi:hypothetical protein
LVVGQAIGTTPAIIPSLAGQVGRGAVPIKLIVTRLSQTRIAANIREEPTMLTRRSIAALLPATVAGAAGSGPGAAWYNAVGPTLTCWKVDIASAALTKQDSVTLPALAQYAWRHPARPILYVASSNFVPMGNPDGKHHLAAFHIDPASGALTPFGEPVPLRARPINISVDAKGE